jgi:anti-anti-sigma regulatory factor
LKIVGVDSPFIHLSGRKLSKENESDNAIVSKINASRPDILLLGFGNPKQEVWFERNRYKLDVPVTIGVGGTFSFIAGTVRRAPAWVQSLGMEWVFRILQEPGRLWKRYAEGLLKFGLMAIPPITVAVLMGKKTHTDTASLRYKTLRNERQEKIHCIRLPRQISRANLSDVIEFCRVCDEENTILDFTDVARIDLQAMAGLVRLFSSLSDSAGGKILCGFSTSLRRRLMAMGVLSGLETLCTEGSLAKVIRRHFRTDRGSIGWVGCDSSDRIHDAFPQGDLINSMLVDDPFGLNFPPAEFKPLRIHLEGLDRIDNAAQIYLLDGARRHGPANVQFVDPHRVLMLSDEGAEPAGRLDGRNIFHAWSSPAMAPSAQLAEIV